MKKGLKFAADLHSSVPPDWYYQSIRENPLQEYWHKMRFRKVREYIQRIEGEVLDIGSADGVFTKQIQEGTGAKVIGIDVRKASVDWANRHWKDKRMHFQVGDAHELAFEDARFDAVFALEVLEHIEDPKRVLKEIKRVLKKGGHAVLLVPTDIWYFKFLWDNFWTKFRGKVWNDTHLQSFQNDSLIDLAKKVGFSVERTDTFLLGMLRIIKVKK